MNTERRLSKIIKNWFINEPLLFSVVTSHNLVLNDSLSVPMRTGLHRIEFSQDLTGSLSDAELSDLLKIEAYRILLKHPYARQPHKANPVALILASDVMISKFFTPPSGIETAGLLYLKSYIARDFLNTTEDLTFEQWYKKIFKIIQERSSGGQATGEGALSDYDITAVTESSGLWKEDENAQNDINDKIKKADIEEGWGTTGGTLQRTLESDVDFSFDYRRALTKFRANIVSANRRLTRMRPSRRYGFNAMGSRYERKADILIAVDVSGSITDESFNRFYHAIKNFFFLGIIENIDLIFFDVNLKNTTPVKFSKNFKLKDISGRGGTNFQPAIDCFIENKNRYAGMIIFTDGEGEVPELNTSASILWILDSRLAFEKSRWWIERLSGNWATFLPD